MAVIQPFQRAAWRFAYPPNPTLGRAAAMPRSKDESRRRFRDEPEARAFLIDQLSPDFQFWEEVRAIGVDGDSFNLDAVSKCRASGHVIGWEFKKSPLFKSEFADALRQAIHYRFARIADNRLPELQGAQLAAIAVFPDWDGTHDDDISDYSREAAGMRVLAGQFRVGAVRLASDSRLSFIMSENAIWHSDAGWNKNAEGVLYGKRGLGSARKKDRRNEA